MHAKNDTPPLACHSKAVLGCLLVAGLFSAGSWIWLAWTSRGVDERWSTATGTLTDRTLGKLVNVSLPTHRKPSEQLDYWQPRLEQILADNPDDAELFAAAALMMDQPSNHVKTLAGTEVLKSNGNGWTIGRSAFGLINQWCDVFDQQATPIALQYIQQARELQPDHPGLLRVQAHLSLTPWMYSENAIDRTSSVDEMVQAASRIDSDNAVYELIQASIMMKDSIQRDENTGEFGDLVFADEAAAIQAIELATSAVKKSSITIGEPMADAVRRVHSLAGHPPYGTIQSQMSHSTSLRLHQQGLVHLIRNIFRCGEIYERLKQPERAKECYLAGIAITDAVLQKSDQPIRHNGINYSLLKWGHQLLLTLSGEKPEDLSAESDAAKAMAAEAAFNSAVKKANLNQTDPVHWFHFLLPSICESMLIACVILIAPFAIYLFAVRKQVALKLGWWPILLGLVALSASLLFWGVGPAGFVSENIQDWLANIAMLLVVGTTIFAVLRRRSKPFQFGLRSLLAFSFVCAIAIQSVIFFQIGIPASVRAKPDQLLQGVANASPTDPSAWLPGNELVRKSTMQWLVQEGPAITLGLALLFLLLQGIVFSKFRQACVSAGLLVCIVTFVCLGTWAWTFPSTWAVTEQKDRSTSLFINSPNEYYRPLEKALEQQQSNPVSQRTYIEPARSDLQEF